MAPLSVNAPVVLMRVSEVKVIGPAYVDAELLELNSAPLLLTPVPLNVSGSSVEILKPAKSSADPLSTITPLVTVPIGELAPLLEAPSLIMPADIVVAPV